LFFIDVCNIRLKNGEKRGQKESGTKSGAGRRPLVDGDFSTRDRRADLLPEYNRDVASCRGREETREKEKGHGGERGERKRKRRSSLIDVITV